VLFYLKNGTEEEQKKYEMIQTEFSNLFRTLELDVRLGGDNNPLIIIKKVPINYAMPLENVGAGVGEMIILLTHLIGSKGLIFALDLPEMQFHPHAQRMLLSVLEKHTKNNQIILVTHSALLLNPEELENIVIIREKNGTALAYQLPNNYFTETESKKLERFLLTDTKDFFFSKAVLLVEGPTEIGAMPVFSDYLGVDCNLKGVSIVQTGKHFGLFVKLLRGFDFPFFVMVDKDTVINIEQSIQVGNRRIDTSPVFCNLHKIGLLEKEDLKQIASFESKIYEKVVRKNKKRFYPEELFEELRMLALKYNVYVLSSDFEGVLKKEGYNKLLKEANSIADSKVIQGRIVAEQIVEKRDEIPKDFARVIYAVKKLIAPNEKSN
jgi:predicted ATP-dependent endonuclease of OLD family